MKNINTRIFSTGFFLLVIAGSFTTSCNQAGAKQDQAKTVTTTESIPDLLTRNDALIKAYPLEWKDTQSMAGELFDRIKKNPADLPARLKLSELYIMEARVTGEHPHYYS